MKNIEWSRKVFQLEHGAQLRVWDMRRAPNCFLLSRKNCHGNSIKVGRCKQPLQWTFFCHDSRTQRPWIGIACVLGETGCACAGVSEEVEVNRKTFAHASHPSFLPSFLPGNDNTVTHIYLGDCNAQLIPRQCGHQPIRIVSASQSDRTSLQKIARVNSVGARTT